MRVAAATAAVLLVATASPATPPAAAHSPLPASASPRPVLALGDQGDDVRLVQQRLRLPVDGRFGARTRNAVQVLQGAAGLKADGVVGPATWAALGQTRLAPPPGTPTGVRGRVDLSDGAVGPAVADAQALLTRAGHRVAADGRFGPATHAAVVAFQRRRGLQADGVVSARTWAALASPAVTPIALVSASSSPWQLIGSRTHLVRAGDTWTSIAAANGSRAAPLATANRVATTVRPAAGSRIQVPGTWTCPVADGAFINDYGFPRGVDRLHQGNDLFAPRGTPVRAPVGGRVEVADNPVGGLSVRLYGADGHRYYLAHLDRRGAIGPVEAGAVLGYVGSSGNAASTPPHLHFEIRPGGGDPVNPFPSLTLACRR